MGNGESVEGRVEIVKYSISYISFYPQDTLGPTGRSSCGDCNTEVVTRTMLTDYVTSMMMPKH